MEMIVWRVYVSSLKVIAVRVSQVMEKVMFSFLKDLDERVLVMENSRNRKVVAMRMK